MKVGAALFFVRHKKPPPPPPLQGGVSSPAKGIARPCGYVQSPSAIQVTQPQG